MEPPTKNGNPNQTTESSTPVPHSEPTQKSPPHPLTVTGLSVQKAMPIGQTHLIKWKQWLCFPNPNECTRKLQ